MLQDELSHLFNECPQLSGQVDVFNCPLPEAWLKDAFELTESVTVRRRKLLPEDITRLVIGMSLMRNEPILEVANRLAFSSKGLDKSKLVASSSISEARQKLGWQPIEWLFNRSAEHWAAQHSEVNTWHGLQLMAIDGTAFRTEDTEECREYFGSANTSGPLESGYPVMRMTCLMNVRTHLVVRAAVGKYREGEITQASQLIDNVPDRSVLLMDTLYHSAELLHHIETTGEQRYWVTPLKKDINYRMLEQYADGSMLVERDICSRTRSKSPSLPKRWQFRLIRYQFPGFPERLIATSLPHEHYSAEEICALYHERWEIELGYREVKQTLLKKAVTLRSKKVSLVLQEAYGMLLAYNLVRQEMVLAAQVADVPPTRISFKSALRVVMYDYYSMATASNQQTLPARLKDLTDTIKDFILPETKRPSYPRAVKVQPSKFPLKRSQKKKDSA